MKGKKFTVVGGDMRLVHLLCQLQGKAYCAEASALFMEKAAEHLPAGTLEGHMEEALPKSDVVIFGVPMLDPEGRVNAPLGYENPGVKALFTYISPETVVFGGGIPQAVITQANQKKIEVLDYMTREEFAVRNAIPTAEGAVEIALKERESTLYGANCLVLGYGRIAKVLTRLLLAFGANVTAAARKPGDLEWISVAGAQAVHISKIDPILPTLDLIFNTVPALLIDEQRLRRVQPDCLIIDLASKPGGVDFEAARRLGKKTIWALSLPGKLAPVSAGGIILDTVANMLYERGIIHE